VAQAFMGLFPGSPFNVQSGWMPEPGHPALIKFIAKVMDAPPIPPSDWAPSVQALNELLEENDVLGHLVDNACKENWNLIASHTAEPADVPIPRIPDRYALLNGFNYLLSHAPSFIDDALVGLPFSGWVVGIDPTLSGSALLRLPHFNDKMGEILDDWHKFLGTPASNVVFRKDGKQWLSPKAKKSYDFPIWEKDNEDLPYWNSWNSFFTRQFKDPAKSRPIDAPDTNKIVNSANDGSLFRWRSDLKETDVFWFKDMAYSLSDILSSPVPGQQRIIDEHQLVEMFTGGYIFQTYLNPYNFHRWWIPVNGEVLFDPLVIPGFYFSKLILPDYGGATTASLPFLAQVNARGLIVIKTEEYGYVCCVPLGMSEVSTISFSDEMVKGAQVTKGQEMGTFNYGGSSFAILFQNLPDKKLIFMQSDGELYEENPPGASSSSGTGGEPTWIGSQIGVWVDLEA
jgi:phosphatidylserine decarboxylase